MKLLSSVALLLLVFSYGVGGAQTVPLTIATNDKSITLNEFKIDSKSTIADVRKILGPETRIMRPEGKNVSLIIYDSLGVNFMVRNNDERVIKMDVYFTTSGQFETSPKRAFSNKVSVNGTPVAKDEPIEDINSKTGNLFKPLSDFLPWFVYESGEFMAVIAYARKEKSKVDSIYVVFQKA